MENTHFPFHGTPQQLKKPHRFDHAARGFEYTVMQSQAKLTSTAKNVNLRDLSTAGGIASTVTDLIRWSHTLYLGNIIPSWVVELLTTQYIPKHSCPLYDGLNDLYHGYGLDIYASEGQTCYQHCGGVPEYQNRLIYDGRNNDRQSKPSCPAIIKKHHILIIRASITTRAADKKSAVIIFR